LTNEKFLDINLQWKFDRWNTRSVIDETSQDTSPALLVVSKATERVNAVHSHLFSSSFILILQSRNLVFFGPEIVFQVLDFRLQLLDLFGRPL
jgi:ABC-type uncharacterized transport system substrate-binding protein